MRENTLLIEKSFADAIAMIAAAEELPEEKRRHWTTSLRQVAKALDRPLEVIPARYSAVRVDLINLHEVPAGVSAKTLQNHKSNTKSALLYLARQKGVPEHGAPLVEEWEALKAKIKGSLVRHRLSSLMRFCSANGIKPGEVTESVVERFIDYRSRCGKPADTAFQRLMARAWNANVGMIPDWPDVKLVEPPVKSTVEIAWSDFPEGLRRDVDSYLEGLTEVRRNRKGQRVRPLKPVTLRTRRAELQGAARMAVKVGVPIENLKSLAALLAPEVAEQVLEAYCKKNGEKPKLYTIDLAGRFLSIARETRCLNEEDCELLNEMREELDEERPEGFTDKNASLIMQILVPDVWDRVVNLPFAMMARARRNRARAPVQSAVEAQVTLENIELYIAELKERVRSVTVWNCIYKLRVAAKLLDPKADFAWLSEIEQDLALVMEPRSKFDRVVLAERLVEAGLTLVTEAEAFSKYPYKRAIAIRNGLIIALLAVCPIRIKNYAALEIGRTFKQEQGSWWISLPYGSTKTNAADQRPVPDYLEDAIELYLTNSRLVLIGSRPATNSLWISSRTGRRYTTKNLGTQISKITLETIGVDVSPHLFRTAAATTSALYGTDMPHLASAVLGHSDPRVTEKHYIRATTINAAKKYASILRQRRRLESTQPET